MRRPTRRLSNRGFICAAAIALGACALLPWLSVLEVTDATNGKIRFQRWVRPGTLVRVTAYHSVEKSFLTDFLRAESEGLVLTGSRFATHGAGLPTSYAPGESWQNQPGAFTLDGRHRTLRSFLLRVGGKNQNPLRVGLDPKTRQGGISPVLGPGLYQISVRRRSLFSWALP